MSLGKKQRHPPPLPSLDRVFLFFWLALALPPTSLCASLELQRTQHHLSRRAAQRREQSEEIYRHCLDISSVPTTLRARYTRRHYEALPSRRYISAREDPETEARRRTLANLAGRRKKVATIERHDSSQPDRCPRMDTMMHFSIASMVTLTDRDAPRAKPADVRKGSFRVRAPSFFLIGGRGRCCVLFF